MSNKKSILNQTTLASGSSDTINLPIIPNGETWVITEFGCCDINLGNNKSSVYALKWDGTIVDGGITCVTGQTVVNRPASGWEFVGDGVKRPSVQRWNTDSSTKKMPFWIIAYKRS